MILGTLCVVLGAALLYRQSAASVEKTRNLASIRHFSNEWACVSQKLHEQKLVNMSVERDLATQSEELVKFSNQWVSATTELAQFMLKAQADSEVAKTTVGNQDARISGLESGRNEMTSKMTELTAAISNLETQIAQTERKLEDSRQDRDYLMKELKRLRAEKAGLEKRLYDLAALREQVRQLRDELSVTRRLERIRRGLYGDLKAAELLHKDVVAATPARPNYNLDVEVRRDGAAQVLTSGQ